jgi:hypothetical protein
MMVKRQGSGSVLVTRGKAALNDSATLSVPKMFLNQLRQKIGVDAWRQRVRRASPGCEPARVRLSVLVRLSAPSRMVASGSESVALVNRRPGGLSLA